MNELYEQATAVMRELGEKTKLKPGDIVVIGCSTSEIIGSKIGTNSSPDVAGIVFKGIYDYAKEKRWRLAFQCCEHLNRAIVVEKTTVPNEEIVNVVPSQTECRLVFCPNHFILTALPPLSSRCATCIGQKRSA